MRPLAFVHYSRFTNLDPFTLLNFQYIATWSVIDIHTYTRVLQCSLASVGLAKACSKSTEVDQMLVF